MHNIISINIVSLSLKHSNKIEHIYIYIYVYSNPLIFLSYVNRLLERNAYHHVSIQLSLDLFLPTINQSNPKLLSI